MAKAKTPTAPSKPASKPTTTGGTAVLDRPSAPKPLDASAAQAAAAQVQHLPTKVFEELKIVKDPNNLFHQTIEQVLIAAQLCGLRHHQQIILAQPKNEIIVHFPVFHYLMTGWSFVFVGLVYDDWL